MIDDACREWVERQLAAATPLTQAQRDQLAELLRPVRLEQNRQARGPRSYVTGA